MIISFNFLNSFFKEKLPSVEKLCSEITMHAFEVEKPVKVNDDYALDIKILPDRGSDALSHFGIARECSAILGLSLENIKKDIIEDHSLDIHNFLSVEVKNKDCKRYTARVLTGITITESPKWIKDRLKVCGITPLNNVVDVTNYVMLELGQPLHAYDYEKLSENKKIIIKKAKKDEKIKTLSSQSLPLESSILTIRDEEDPLAIAGIKGGKKAEINANTKAIVIESANFNGSLISKTSKKLKLRTDSSFIFEHNIDRGLTEIALERATHLIQKLTGATVLKGVIDIYNEKEPLKTISLNLDYLESFLGIKIEAKEVKKILKSLEFKIKTEKNKTLQVIVPSFRKDIEIQENLIEEIGRIYGYDKIKSVLPLSASKIKKNEKVFVKNNLRSVFKELGFSEVYNHPFISKKDKEKFNLTRLVEIENPIAVDSEYLTPRVLLSLVRNLKLNLKYEKNIKLYEIGKTFKKNGSFLEKETISGIVSNQDYRVLKGYLEEVFKDFGMLHIEYIPNSKDSFFSKRKSAIIKVNKREIGQIGHLSNFVLEKLDLKLDPVLFELNFDAFKKEAIHKNEFIKISPHPTATRDVSVIVPSITYIDNIMDIIKISETKFIKDIELLDIYNDYKENLKSITFRIYLQREDRSLESSEINQIQDKIISNLMQNQKWEVKKS